MIRGNPHPNLVHFVIVFALPALFVLQICMGLFALLSNDASLTTRAGGVVLLAGAFWAAVLWALLVCWRKDPS